MWNWLLNIILPWRWFKKKEEPTTLAAHTPAEDAVSRTYVDTSLTPARNPEHYKSRAHYREKYYRRGNNFYDVDDDSLIEDLILLTLLMDIFDDVEAQEIVEDIVINENIEPETNIADDIAAIDAAEEAVRESYVEPDRLSDYADIITEPAPEPSYSEPEPSKSYGGGGSDYDGGGSS